MATEHFSRATLLVALGLVAAVGCRRDQAQGDSKARTANSANQESAENAQAKAAAEQEQATAKQALERWTARMKAISGALPAAEQLKPGCESLAASTPLASVDSALLDSIKRSPGGVVSATGSAGFAMLQSQPVRVIFHQAHRSGTTNWKQLMAASIELDAARFLAVFDLAEVAQPNMLSRDSWAGGSMKGALVVFDLSHDTAVCRIPLAAKLPSKSDLAKRKVSVDTSGVDVERQLLDLTAQELRKKAEERMTKLDAGAVSLAAGATG
jgi:hypothetical protein